MRGRRRASGAQPVVGVEYGRFSALGGRLRREGWGLIL